MCKEITCINNEGMTNLQVGDKVTLLGELAQLPGYLIVALASGDLLCGVPEDHFEDVWANGYVPDLLGVEEVDE